MFKKLGHYCTPHLGHFASQNRYAEKMDGASSSCTLTQRLQSELEKTVASLYEAFDSASDRERTFLLELQHDEHEEFSTRGLRRLSAGFYVLDASRPWLCYWILHSLALIGRSVDDVLYNRTVDFLKRCEDSEGGYGGGPGQMAHLATTYAATCALVTLGGETALSSLNREKIRQFLLRMKDPSGGFRVHTDGEMDMRGCYTALAIAHLLNIAAPELAENVGTYVRSCQTYEGGIGGEPGSEAHGGYTFCGLAALALINELHVLDLPSLVNWVAFRQGKVEGGFQGRTNKLVDGCYSFWQGGCFRMLQQYMPHLWAQQTSLVKAMCLSEGQVTNTDILNTANVDCQESAFSDCEGKTSPPKKTGYDTLLCEVQADETKQTTQSSINLVQESSPFVRKATEGELACQTEAGGKTCQTTSADEIDRIPKTELQTTDGFKSHTWNVGLNESDSDVDDKFEFWGSDSKTYQNAAEKLFPMLDINFQKLPFHTKRAELVELADHQHGPQSRTSPQSRPSEASFPAAVSSSVNFEDWDYTLCAPFFNSQALQAYILLCCQDLSGGLRDKPGKPCDFYHTCYGLSGLSVAQYSTAYCILMPPPPAGVVGPYSNLVEATNVICNVRLDRYCEAQSHFKRCNDLQ